jgi:hypothetical protein
MLARYAHLCAKHLAKRLDAVFADAGVKLDGGHRSGHKGRRRLGGKEGLSVREVLAAPPDSPAMEPTRCIFPVVRGHGFQRIVNAYSSGT